MDPKTTKLERTLFHERQIVCCRYSPDSTHLFGAGYDGMLHRWTLDTNPTKTMEKRKEVFVYNDQHASFQGHGGWVETMARHPDGKRLFTADSWGQIQCWPLGTGKLAPIWSVRKAHSTWLRRLVISPSGNVIATCGNDNRICVFSTDKGKLLHELKGHEHHVQSVAFHGDGKSLASGDLFGNVRHWDLTSGKCVREMDASKLYKKYQQYDQGGVRCMTFDTGFSTLYCAGFEGTNANQGHGNPTVVALDWGSGKQKTIMTTKQAFKGPILDVVYHPAGYLMGAGSSEAGGALWFWKPGQEKEEHSVKYRTSFRGLELHPDGKKLAVAAFGDNGGQRGGNGRRLNKEGEYEGFGGSVAFYALS